MNGTTLRRWTLAGLVSLGVIGVTLLVGGCDNGQDGEVRESQQGDSTAAGDVAMVGGVVNATCPMMGSKIDPAKVPENLTRKWKGQVVGFCCGGCPGAWDKLSDADRATKLKAAIPKAPDLPST